MMCCFEVEELFHQLLLKSGSQHLALEATLKQAERRVRFHACCKCIFARTCSSFRVGRLELGKF